MCAIELQTQLVVNCVPGPMHALCTQDTICYLTLYHVLLTLTLCSYMYFTSATAVFNTLKSFIFPE